MIVFLAIFLVVCLYGVKVKPVDGQPYMTDYMSVEKTMAIKGIFIIIVFFEHFNEYVTYQLSLDIMYADVYKHIAERMVTMFLFYSGYGVMESIRKKQMSYIRKIPVTRVLGTLFQFDLAVLLFAAVDLILGIPFTPKQFLLSLIARDSLGNSTWYIFAIVVAYLMTYIAFMIWKDKGKYFPAATTVTLFILIYIYCFAHFQLGGTDWYVTIILYACGIWYSLLREKIEKFINKNLAIYLCFLIPVLILEVVCSLKRDGSFLFTELSMLFFAAAVVLFTMRVSIGNAVLRWCGKNLFGLYILQRLPMIVFEQIGVADFNIYLYFVLCFAVTVLLAWLFDKYVGKLWKLLITKKKNKKEPADA